ncbi:MAG TPA: hypothetical protein PKE19_00955 [Aestuariivirga sp.]|nr:hypothetical protein [Aestuariivirga sp.]
MTAPSWFTRLAQWLETRPPGRAVAVCFPSYRPDLVTDLAMAAGLNLVDFRKTVMQPMGWQAGQLPLSSLNEAANAVHATGTGVVLMNAEALLAVSPAAERRRWLADTLAHEWPHRLVLPIALFAHELPDLPEQVTHLAPAELPAESLLTRLGSLS